MKYAESIISAHHNYLVNNVLTPGFVLGDPDSGEEFFFLADVVPPERSTPRISARLFDDSGALLLELRENTVSANPGGCLFRAAADGFRIVAASGESLLGVQTQVFTNGFLTRIQGRLHDRQGNLRMEPSYEGVRVHGQANTALRTPLRPAS